MAQRVEDDVEGPRAQHHGVGLGAGRAGPCGAEEELHVVDGLEGPGVIIFSCSSSSGQVPATEHAPLQVVPAHLHSADTVHISLPPLILQVIRSVLPEPVHLEQSLLKSRRQLPQLCGAQLREGGGQVSGEEAST